MKMIQMIVKSICDSFFSYSVMKENTNKISKKIPITQGYDRDLGVYVIMKLIYASFNLWPPPPLPLLLSSLNFIKVCFRYQD